MNLPLIIENLQELKESLSKAELANEPKVVEYYTELVAEHQNALYFIKKAQLCYTQALMSYMAYQTSRCSAQAQQEADKLYGPHVYESLANIAFELEKEIKVIGIEIGENRNKASDLHQEPAKHQPFNVEPLK